MQTDWNKRLLDLAEHVGKWSKDRQRGVGAVITDSDHRILSIGYNGFPQGAEDDREERHERPLKYKWTEHAERNAIFSAAKNGVALLDSQIYIKWFPCADCARAIVQSGIKKLICTAPDFNHPRWGDDFQIADQILLEGDVEVQIQE